MATSTWLSPLRYKLVLEVHLVMYTQHSEAYVVFVSLEMDVTKIQNGKQGPENPQSFHAQDMST